MPLVGVWYSLTEVGVQLSLSYFQVVHLVRKHRKDNPEWLQKTSKGIFIRADGLEVLRQEHKPSDGYRQ